MRVLWLFGLAACGASDAAYGSFPDGGVHGGASDAGFHCLSSNECPTGQVCNEFGVCEAPPPMTGDAGAPPEVEYTFSAPIASRRFFYVAMTQQNELARIDGRTLAVSATPVGQAPRTVA